MSRTLTVAPVRKSVRVNAPPARAFEVFTAGFGRWWPRSHSVSASPMVDAIIEPHVGGRWYQKCEDGSECQWGKVLLWEPPERVILAWQLNPDFQYDPDTITEVELRFTAQSADATLVELEHRYLERFGERGKEMAEKVGAPNGWPDLLNIYAASV